LPDLLIDQLIDWRNRERVTDNNEVRPLRRDSVVSHHRPIFDQYTHCSHGTWTDSTDTSTRLYASQSSYSITIRHHPSKFVHQKISKKTQT